MDTVSVTFRELRDEEPTSRRESHGHGRAYGIQGYGATIVQRVDGDFFAVMGLSLVRLVSLLAKHGVSYDFRGVRVT